MSMQHFFKNSLLENIENENNLNAYFDYKKLCNVFFVCAIIMPTAHASSAFLSSFSINLLAFYHECCSLIGYTTRYLHICISIEF